MSKQVHRVKVCRSIIKSIEKDLVGIVEEVEAIYRYRCCDKLYNDIVVDFIKYRIGEELHIYIFVKHLLKKKISVVNIFYIKKNNKDYKTLKTLIKNININDELQQEILYKVEFTKLEVFLRMKILKTLRL